MSSNSKSNKGKGKNNNTSSPKKESTPSSPAVAPTTAAATTAATTSTTPAKSPSKAKESPRPAAPTAPASAAKDAKISPSKKETVKQQEQEQQEQQQIEEEEQTVTVDQGKSLEEAVDTLAEKLPKRPAPEQIKKSGLIRRSSDIADTLLPAATQVEKKIVEKRVADSLKKKSQPISPNSKRIVTSETGIAGSLAATAKDLEMKIHADTVAHLLENRPTKEDLKVAGVVDPTSGQVSDRILNMQKTLETNIKRDQVGHLLETRPRVEDLKYISGMNDPVAPSIRGRRRSLEFGINKSQLNRHLMARPDYQQLIERGIIAPVDDNGSNQKETVHAIRVRLALGLKCASRLHQLGMINDEGKGYLKNLVLDNDARVSAAIEVFDADHDISELLDTMHRIALSKPPEPQN